MVTFDPNNPTASGMVLTFDDEFNSASISTDNVANGTLWNNHLWYEGPSNGTTVANGVATIIDTNLSTVNASGQGFAQKFGYFEADVKLPAGMGAWPAFWLMSQAHAQNGANPASEIDIMEGQGSLPNLYFTTLHYMTGTSQDTYNPNPNWTPNLGDLTQSYHRYGLLWSPDSDQLTFYFDGKQIATATKYSTTDYSPDMLILSTSEGNMIGNNYPNGTHPPLYADYVRVYQFTSQNPTEVIAQQVSAAAGQTDTTALVSAKGAGGTTGGPTSTSSSPPSGSAGSNPLTLKVAADLYNGNAQIAVLVDGKQVGTYGISAHHSQGQAQTISVGNYDPTVAHQVQVQFLNDAWDGTPNADGHDRNVYVEQVALNGFTLSGEKFSGNDASLGQGSIDPHAAVMLINGTASYSVAADPPAVSGSAGGTTTATGGTAITNPLTLGVAADLLNGDPHINVIVDGLQVGAYDISAHHSQGQVQTISVGNFDPTVAHQVQVQFTNDAWDGLSGDGHDRNVYVEQVTLNGLTLSGEKFASNGTSLGLDSIDPHAAVMLISGTTTYNIAAAPPAVQAPLDTADGVIVVGSGGTVGTAAGNSFAISAVGQITENGTVMPETHGVTELVYLNHTLYQEATAQNLWFSLNESTNKWTLLTGSPVPGSQPGLAAGTHDLYLVNSSSTNIGHIADFNPSEDILDLVPALKAAGYAGKDPIADHVVNLIQAGTSTAVMIDPTGHDPNHGTLVVTLDHVLPQSIPAVDIWH